MKKNHKILVLIGIVLVVVVAGVVFQVDKTNKTLAYNKQQQEIKTALENKIAFDKQKADQLAKQLNAEPIEKKAVDQAWNLIRNNFNSKSRDQYFEQAGNLVKDYSSFISKYKEDAHAIYVDSQIKQIITKYWAGMTPDTSYDASGKYDDQETYSRDFINSNKLTVAALD